MFQVVLGEVVDRQPDFSRAGPYERFEDAGEVYVVRRLPIRFASGFRRG
ncbi:hypothetical protein [Mycobacterium deserti]|uniref:Uncharacterized protein n=1 Tax=Mycobacterium deserti TaxID=2978347 RepID=A0ABT2M4C1_9MYCO|nr:hypothetical protein [Mycobacterium deserti]MCT7657109.1 hypothetical protein [Mycobacterium deserti]